MHLVAPVPVPGGPASGEGGSLARKVNWNNAIPASGIWISETAERKVSVVGSLSHCRQYQHCL